jgi:predicted RNA-binding protein with TRAM domain
MERDTRGFDEPEATEVNPDTLEPVCRQRGPRLEGDFTEAGDTDSIDVTEVSEDEDGAAYLTGRVSDVDDVENAEEVAGRIAGVRDVVEELELD